MSKITIVLADDHQVVRLGLRTLLESQSDLQVLAEASNGVEAVSSCELLKPDVIVLDLMMPDLNGIMAASQIRQRCPKVQIIILSMYDNEAYIAESFSAGASAYVLKQSTTEDLVMAVREVMQNRRYLSPALSERAIDAYIHALQSSNGDSQDVYSSLTPREREVFMLAAQGFTSRRIAEHLSISPRTVESHRASMMHKLGLKNQIDLLRYAARRGLIPEP